MNGKPVIFGKKGRTTIPLPLRRKLGWQAGDTIRFRLDGDRGIVSRDKPPAREHPAPEHPAQVHPAMKLAAELSGLAQLLAQLAPLVFGGGGSG
jgi:AbrB family looped-hinge helix DNA binding protein